MLLRRLGLALSLTVHLFALAQAAENDNKKLHGTWFFDLGNTEEDGFRPFLTFGPKNLLQFTVAQGTEEEAIVQTEEGSYTMDLSKSPSQLDFELGKKGKVKTIFELKDDTLRIENNPPGEDRPMRFSNTMSLKRYKGKLPRNVRPSRGEDTPKRVENRPEPGSLAHFRFNGDAKDANKGNPEFELKNTEFIDDSLYLNGLYELGRFPEKGYQAACLTPDLDYNQFTVALRFKAQGFSYGKSNLLTGGRYGRWFGMSRSADGNLTITLNNHGFSHEIKDAGLEPRKWTVVACGVDVTARKVIVSLNGKKAAAIDLPKGYKLNAIDYDDRESDKVWLFADYSNARTFHGLVDELIIYGRMLSEEEFEKIPLRP